MTLVFYLFDLEYLAWRLRTYIERRDRLKPEASRLLEATLIRGQSKRGETPQITGLPDETLEVLFPKLYPIA